MKRANWLADIKNETRFFVNFSSVSLNSVRISSRSLNGTRLNGLMFNYRLANWLASRNWPVFR